VLTSPVLPTYFEYRDLGVPSSDTARLRQLRDGLSADQLARRRATVTAEGLNRGDTAHYTDREKSARWQIVFGATNLYHVERWRQVRGGQVFYNPRVSRAIYANSSQAQRDSLWGRFLPALGSFAGPVTVVIGDADFVDPGAALWRYALARLPRAQLIMLSQTGHSAWIDQPERFHDAVSGALRRALVANP
jgi:pimeloyl-ACP methyl ester carboxylesterase